MAKQQSVVGWMPIELFDQAKVLSKQAELKDRISGFKIMGGLLPQRILSMKLIRLPKSKDKLVQIDVRHILKM